MPNWVVTHDTEFAGAANTSVGAAGSTTGWGDDWIDDGGSTLSIQDALGIFASTSDYLSHGARRPLSEAQGDQQVELDLAGVTNGSSIGIELRLSGLGSTKNCYLIEFDPSPTTGRFEAYAVVNGAIAGNLPFQSGGFAWTTGVPARFLASVVGTSPATVVASLLDASGATIATQTVNDSTAGAPTSGVAGITSTYNGGCQLSGIKVYSNEATSAATTYAVTGAATAHVGDSDVYTFTPNGTLTGTITPKAGGTLAGSFSPATLTWSGTSDAKTSTFTSSSTGSGAISGTNTGSLTNPAGVSLTVYPQPITILVSDPHWPWPLATTYINGSVSAETTNAGNGFRGLTISIPANSDGMLALLVDCSRLAGASSTPTIRWSVDGEPTTDHLLVSGDTAIVLATGLASGTHTVTLMLVAQPGDLDRWGSAGTPPANRLVTTGLQAPAGSTLLGPPARSAKAIFYGDSIVEGVNIGPGLSSYIQTNYDGTASFAHLMGLANNWDLSQIGWSSMGFTKEGDGAVPQFATSWDHYDYAHSRAAAIAAADILLECVSTNDARPTAATDATITADTLAQLQRMRAANATARIISIVPPGGYFESAKLAAYQAYQAATPDARCFFWDGGTVASVGLTNLLSGTPTAESEDGTHPGRTTHGKLASLYNSLFTASGYTDPGITHVQSTTTYQFAGTTLTGTYAGSSGGTIPASADVRLGTAVGSTFGTLHVPNPAQVLAGIAVDATTGTVVLPAANQVVSTATFGPGSATTGTVVIPSAADVELGISYGPGSVLTGTFVGSGGGSPSEIATAVVTAMATAPVGSVANLSGVNLDGATVASSPSPGPTIFSVTGLPSGLASGDLTGMSLIFQTGNRAGARRSVLTHVRSNGVDTITLSSALGAAPAPSDTLIFC